MVKRISKTMGKVFSCLGSKENVEDDKRPLRRKMVIVGDGECGKTCLVSRMCTGDFVDVGYLPTVFDTEVVSVSTGKENVDLTIFDTAGQEDYDRLRPFSYHDIDVALICFSLADSDTLENVTDKWASEVKYFCGNIPIILVGNKKDIRDPPASAISNNNPNTLLSSDIIKFSSSSESSSPVSSTSSSPSSISFPTITLKQSSNNAKTNCDANNNNNEDEEVDRINNKNNSSDRDAINTTTISTSNNSDKTETELNSVTTSLSPTTTTTTTTSTNTNNINNITQEPRISRLIEPSFPFHVQAPVKHSEGSRAANHIGAVAYFETSALTGDNVPELLLATTKASVLGVKKSKNFKPFIGTLKSWKSVVGLEQLSK